MYSFLFRSTWVHSWFNGRSCCLWVFVNFCVLPVFVYCCLFLCFPGLYFVLRYCSLICPFGFSIFFLHHTIKLLAGLPLQKHKRNFIEDHLQFQKRPLKTIHNVDNSDLVANCGNPELTSWCGLPLCWTVTTCT
jgi:hypothetical protein